MQERAALVTAIILERPTCMTCLSQKTGLSVADVDATLLRIQGALRVHRVPSRCLACSGTLEVISIARPDH
jgi:hypothetical protein